MRTLALSLLALLPVIGAAPANHPNRHPRSLSASSHTTFSSTRHIPHASVLAGKRMVRRRVSRVCPAPSSSTSLTSVFTSTVPSSTAPWSTTNAPPSTGYEPSATTPAPSSTTSTPSRSTETGEQPNGTSTDSPITATPSSAAPSTEPPITSLPSTESPPSSTGDWSATQPPSNPAQSTVQPTSTEQHWSTSETPSSTEAPWHTTEAPSSTSEAPSSTSDVPTSTWEPPQSSSEPPVSTWTPPPDPTTSTTPVPSVPPAFNEDEYECLEWCDEDDDDCVPELVTDGPTEPTPTTSTSTTPSPTSPPIDHATVDRDGAGPFSGQGTWFDVGLSACGTYDTNTMPVVAVGEELFDTWPGYNGYNPNSNPICNKHIKVTYKGKSVVVQVTDRCPGCTKRSLDLSPAAFEQLAPLGLGRLVDGYTSNVQWEWVTGEGRLPELPLNGSTAWPGLD